jgi:hypothetical protein
MTHQENQSQIQSSSEEAEEELNQKQLEAIVGGSGVTMLKPAALGKSFSASDLSRVTDGTKIPADSPVPNADLAKKIASAGPNGTLTNLTDQDKRDVNYINHYIMANKK